MALTPTTLSETVGVGESITLGVKAKALTTFAERVNVHIVDRSGLLDPLGTAIQQNVDGTYSATLKTAKKLVAGTFNGNIEVQLYPESGGAQLPGSPVLLPYTLQVVAATNLSALPRLTGLGDWETFQGNKAHTGYVSVTLDPAAFSPRWRWVTPKMGYQVSPVATANGVVYVSAQGSTESKHLFGVKEADASILWDHDFGTADTVGTLNPPAAAMGKVFVTSCGLNDTAMWSFAADTGTQLSRTSFASQFGQYYAPTLAHGAVYTNGGSYGGVNAFNAADGASRWFAALAQTSDHWTPAADEDRVYTFANGVFTALDPATGSAAYTMTDPAFGGANMTPVLGPANTAFVPNTRGFQGNFLACLNLTSRTTNWSTQCNMSGNPAVANGVVYALNAALPVANGAPTRLEARSVTDGSLLWSWTPTREREYAFVGDVLVTDNLVFVSTNLRTYAISLSTHQPVWTHWKPGYLAISASGVLYISTLDGGFSDGGLTAINLK